MAATDRICGSCRTPVPTGAAFCSTCGAPTPTETTDAFGGDFEARLRAALADRYRIERELGRGGMAVVYLAEDLRHERRVAVKVLRPELAAVIGAERFVREIKLAARLNHPSILALYDSGEAVAPSLGEGSSRGAGAFLYYVMPFVDGESLRARLQRERQLPIDEALELTREVAEGLDYAHQQGVIHRDVKPENILLARGHALIADFGIAKAVAKEGATHLTSAGTSIGTPLYMSPEQAAADPAMDGRTDIYSLGCVLYEMLAGEPPFSGPTAPAIMAKHAIDPRPSIRTVRDTVPEPVEAAIHRAMAKVPADRFGTGAGFVAALRVGVMSPEGGDRRPLPDASRAPARIETATSPAGSRSTAVAKPLARFRWILVGSMAVAALGIAADMWLGRGVGPGPFVLMAVLLVLGLEYGRLRLAGADWRGVLGFESDAKRTPAVGGRGAEAWASGEQEYGGQAEHVRRARSHRAAIVGLLAQLPRSEQEMLGDVMSLADQLVLTIAAGARALRQPGIRTPGADTPSERRTRENRAADVERELARALAVLENLRSELRQVGRHGFTAAGPALSRVLEEARAVLC